MPNGKICYIELPTIDIPKSSEFYQSIFGWSVRDRGDGTIAFDDSTGQVSGSFDLGRKAVEDPGMIVSIMVDDIRETLGKVEAFVSKLSGRWVFMRRSWWRIFAIPAATYSACIRSLNKA